MDESASPDIEPAPERPNIPEFVLTRTVGEMLAAERRRQGKSLGDIAATTRIRMRMLEALEDGAWETLPSPAYVKGYIQNYATALSLSAEPFLEAYRSESPRDAADILPDAASTAGIAVVPRRDQAHAIPGRVLLGIFAFLAILGLVWLTMSLAGSEDANPNPLPPAVEPQEPAATVPTSPVPGTPDDGSAPAEEVPAVEPFEMTVSVEAGDASWLRVTIDGEKVFEDILQGGRTLSWQVTEASSVRIGRPSVVTITRDGQPVDIPSTSELPTVELVADE